MGSIDGGRPPDGDSCSDEDENPELTGEEQDQQGAFFLPSEWIPVARSFRPYQRPTSEGQMVARRPLVAKLTEDIAETYKVCNPNITFSVLPKRYLTELWKGVYNDGQDNQDTDLILYVDFVLVNSESNIRYVVKELLGKGSFGQVCKCSTSDPNFHGDVAVKVIKNQPAYYNQAQVEIGICYRLQMYTERFNIVRILDHFEFAGHLCLVFELLNANLYDLLKRNQHKGLSMKLVRRFTKQILEALSALRDVGVVHCDLKLENILLQPCLEDANIKLIDFGSACMDFRTVYTYIQSRFYRSPEVLLQLKYTTAIDMWSLGCVSAELFLGLPLFPGACEYDLLRFMIEILGHQPPDHIIYQSEISNKFFKLTSSAPLSGQTATEGQSPAYQLLSEAELEARGQKPKVGKRYFVNYKLEDIILNYPLRRRMTQDEQDEEIRSRLAFVDFLTGVLDFDHTKRWTPGQALEHPFLTGEQLVGPFRPPPEQIRTYVGQWMAMDHNAQTGHWVSGGLSPQVNVPCTVRYPNQGYHPSTIPYNSSYSSAGSFGSYGDPSGLGSSLGSYEATLMHHSYPNTAAMGINGHHHGGAAGGGFVGSAETYHQQRMLVSNVQAHIGMSPSNYRPVPLGASPSHHHQQTLVPNFYGSPGSSFHPSPISYAPSPSSIYHMSPNSQLLLSPGSPSHLSPGRPGPTSPARTGASSLSKMARQNNWSRHQYPSVNGNDSFMRGGGLHGPNFMQNQRNGPGVTHYTQGSPAGFGDGTLGALLNASDNVSEAGEEYPAPPDPKDWDPSYSDEQLLGDSGEASSSVVTAMDVNEMSNGISRLGTESYSGPGQGVGPFWVGHRHGQSTSFSGQSRSNGTQGNSGMMGNGKGSGVSPKSSPLGQQYQPHSQHLPKHANHPSSSRLGPQSHSHYGLLQSPEASSSTGAGIGQTTGESGNHVPNGHLTQAQRGRHTGASHPPSGMCPPVVGNMWPPTNPWVQIPADPNSTWSQPGYSQPYAQNLPHGPSSMNRRPARSLPPAAPGKAHGHKRSA